MSASKHPTLESICDIQFFFELRIFSSIEKYIYLEDNQNPLESEGCTHFFCLVNLLIKINIANTDLLQSEKKFCISQIVIRKIIALKNFSVVKYQTNKSKDRKLKNRETNKLKKRKEKTYKCLLVFFLMSNYQFIFSPNLLISYLIPKSQNYNVSVFFLQQKFHLMIPVFLKRLHFFLIFFPQTKVVKFTFSSSSIYIVI